MSEPHIMQHKDNVDACITGEIPVIHTTYDNQSPVITEEIAHANERYRSIAHRKFTKVAVCCGVLTGFTSIGLIIAIVLLILGRTMEPFTIQDVALLAIVTVILCITTIGCVCRAKSFDHD